MIDYFIQKSVVTLALNFAVCLLGFFILPSLSNEFIPAIEIPAVAVVFPTTLLQSDKVVSTLVAPIERALLNTGDVENIETTLERGRTILLVFYKWTQSPEKCLMKTRTLVEGFQRPLGVLPPLFVLHRPTLSPIFKVALHGKNHAEVSRFAEKAAREIERIPGLAEVRVQGGASRVTVIQVQPEKLTRAHSSFSKLIESSASLWSFRYLFGGSSDLVRVPLGSADELRDYPVLARQGKATVVRKVADIKSVVEPPGVLFGAGSPAVLLEVLKAPGADALSVVDRTLEILKKNGAALAHTIDFTVVYDEAAKIREAQHDVFHNFRDGIILNSIILIFFLGSISGCIIASCVFPTSILGTLVVMKFFGISFNIFSLNGFSLATGMITDAATVLLDSIMRRIEMKEEIESACSKGTRDVANGVFTGVITSCAVLFPICLQSGISSKLFGDLAITLIACNLLCLIGVFTMVPWLSAKLLEPGGKRALPPVAILYSASTQLVKAVIAAAQWGFATSLRSKVFRRVMPLAVSCICLTSLAFIPPSELLPMVKASTYAITIPFKQTVMKTSGASLQQEIHTALSQESKINWLLTYRDADSLQSTLEIDPHVPISPFIEKLASRFRLDSHAILTFPLGPTPPTEPMNFSGYFFIDALLPQEKKAKIIHDFCRTNGILNCVDSAHYRIPTLSLKDKPLVMVREGTNPASSAIELALRMQRLDLSALANLTVPERTLLEGIQLNTSQMNPLQPLDSSILVQGQKAASAVTFRSLYESGFEVDTNKRFRQNGREYEPLYFKLRTATQESTSSSEGKGVQEPFTLGQAVRAMKSVTDSLGISAGAVVGQGSIKNMQVTFRKMISALGIAALLVYAILWIQFQSIVKASIIMVSIPQALGGAIFGLILLHESMNAGVIVGFVLLIGIIVSSGIYLMEALDHALEKGEPLEEAIRLAISRRVRPILMTKFSCIFGMLPTLLFESAGQELYRGMAIVNIFGLCFGTVLTLGVAPILIRAFVRPHSQGEHSYEKERSHA